MLLIWKTTLTKILSMRLNLELGHTYVIAAMFYECFCRSGWAGFFFFFWHITHCPSRLGFFFSDPPACQVFPQICTPFSNPGR